MRPIFDSEIHPIMLLTITVCSIVGACFIIALTFDSIAKAFDNYVDNKVDRRLEELEPEKCETRIIMREQIHYEDGIKTLHEMSPYTTSSNC